MIGPDITRDRALKVLRSLRDIAIDHSLAGYGRLPVPVQPGQFKAWEDRGNELLEVIDALESIVSAMPASSILARGERAVSP